MLLKIRNYLQIFFVIILISERIERISSIAEPFKWMHYKPYGTTVYLEPLFNDTICKQSSDCYWLLPNRTRLNYPLNIERFTISPNGTLTIIGIQPIDNGIYHFFRRNSSDWIVSKALLNIHGAPFDSLWLEYWPNVSCSRLSIRYLFVILFLRTISGCWRSGSDGR